ncbi:hypothetical protein TIFTF001_055526 [Ficus carica]|uniref:Uncharacterized protein n=1 Tax=Ficus carica TaxID=3494 RepID=A0AA88EAV6_FICCA|nr:hypothetical protein TIFTF001_055526 [Ficus carica]
MPSTLSWLILAEHEATSPPGIDDNTDPWYGSETRNHKGAKMCLGATQHRSLPERHPP